MFYTIYKITNKVNGKVYIGKHQTKDVDDGYMGSGKLIRRAIEKYGIENFEKEILFEFSTEEEMNTKEAELVTEEFCNREDTYNLCPGGHGGFGYLNSSGNRSGFETRDGGIYSSIGLAALAEKWNDQEWAERTRRNISESLKSRFSNTEHPWTGRNHTDATKAKIGTANKIAQSGSKNSQFGTMWITNGTENKKIKKVDEIPEGWYKGRK
jgi:hypothetical protein